MSDPAYLIVALSLATYIAPAAWLAEDDATIATAVKILTEQAADAKRKR